MLVQVLAEVGGRLFSSSAPAPATTSMRQEQSLLPNRALRSTPTSIVQRIGKAVAMLSAH